MDRIGYADRAMHAGNAIGTGTRTHDCTLLLSFSFPPLTRFAEMMMTVSLEDYEANLRVILAHFQALSPPVPLVLIAPPPVDVSIQSFAESSDQILDFPTHF